MTATDALDIGNDAESGVRLRRYEARLRVALLVVFPCGFGFRFVVTDLGAVRFYLGFELLNRGFIASDPRPVIGLTRSIQIGV